MIFLAEASLVSAVRWAPKGRSGLLRLLTAFFSLQGASLPWGSCLPYLLMTKGRKKSFPIRRGKLISTVYKLNFLGQKG